MCNNTLIPTKLQAPKQKIAYAEFAPTPNLFQTIVPGQTSQVQQHADIIPKHSMRPQNVPTMQPRLADLIPMRVEEVEKDDYQKLLSEISRSIISSFPNAK